jgi:hypothetical protein
VPVPAGWSLIGNPFNFPLPVKQIALASGGPLQLQAYRGEWQDADGPLEPFEGLAAFSSVADTVLLDPDLSNAPGPAVQIETEPADWAIQVIGASGGARDANNFAALHPAARAGTDEFDRVDPPSIGEFVSVAFATDDRDLALSTDARPLDGGTAAWQLRVDSRSPRRVDLQFDGIDRVPPNLSITVVDLKTGASHDLRHSDRIRVQTDKAGPRQLELVVGRPTGGVSGGSRLLGAYPNPFTDVTSIAFRLAQPSPVRISVYDVLGREVAVIADQREVGAGDHSVVWDGRLGENTRAAAGAYFISLFVRGRPLKATSVLLVR